MPPAFNLSQDQTLQLISSSICYKVTQSTLAPSPSPQQSPARTKKTRLAIRPGLHQNRQPFASCEHFNVSSPHPTDSRLQNRRTRAIPVPTLIGCKLLKSAADGRCRAVAAVATQLPCCTCPPPFGGHFPRCRSAMSKDRDYTSKTGPVNTPFMVRTSRGVPPRPRPQRPDRAAGQASAR